MEKVPLKQQLQHDYHYQHVRCYPSSYQEEHYLKYEIHLNKCKHVIDEITP